MTTNDGKNNVVRIALTNADGTEQSFDVSERFHFLLGFATCGPNGGKGVPLEVIVKGSTTVIGEIFFRIGEEHPDLLDHCARKTIAKTLEKLKAKGIDPGAEAFKNARPVGGVQ